MEAGSDQRGMAIFTGPQAYVTPSWYVTKQETHKVVPTWNYVAVHAYGPVEFFDDPDRLLDVVTLVERPQAMDALINVVVPVFEVVLTGHLAGRFDVLGSDIAGATCVRRCTAAGRSTRG